MKLTRRRLFFAVTLAIGLAFTSFAGWRVYRAWKNHKVKVWAESHGGWVDWGSRSAHLETPKFLQMFFREPILDEIQSVYVSGSFPIGHDDIERLTRLPRLEHVRLNSNGITDEHVAILSRNPTIWALDLAETAITDKSLKTIARRMPQIQMLNISHTNISDAGIDSLLARLSPLGSLDCADTDVSEACLAKIKAAGIDLHPLPTH